MKHLIGLILILAASLCSCSSNRATQNGSGKTLLSYNIVIGESGGFTGNNSGYSIDSTGAVKSFEGIITPEAKQKVVGHLNEEQIQKINQLIPELLKASSSEKANLTSYITLRKDGKVVRYTWPGPSPNKNAPEAINKFYTEVNSIINSLPQKQIRE